MRKITRNYIEVNQWINTINSVVKIVTWIIHGNFSIYLLLFSEQWKEKKKDQRKMSKEERKAMRMDELKREEIIKVHKTQK